MAEGTIEIELQVAPLTTTILHDDVSRLEAYPPTNDDIVHTDYLWFNTKSRQEFIRITDEVAAVVKKSGVKEGMVLVSAMHITSGVYVNDWEDGLIDDFQVWLEKLAPAGLPYEHHRTGEDNADAHLKRTHHGASGDRADHQRDAGSRAVGADLLRGVRRPAEEAGRAQGHGV